MTTSDESTGGSIQVRLADVACSHWGPTNQVIELVAPIVGADPPYRESLFPYVGRRKKKRTAKDRAKTKIQKLSRRRNR